MKYPKQTARLAFWAAIFMVIVLVAWLRWGHRSTPVLTTAGVIEEVNSGHSGVDNPPPIQNLPPEPKPAPTADNTNRSKFTGMIKFPKDMGPKIFISSNVVMQKVVIPHPTQEYFGTALYEKWARTACEKWMAREPALSDLKEILDSISEEGEFTYTGLYEAYGFQGTIKEMDDHVGVFERALQRTLDEINNTPDATEDQRRAAIKQEIESAGIDRMLMDRDRQELIDTTRETLGKLFRKFDKAAFQRISSIRVRFGVEPLPWPPEP